MSIETKIKTINSILTGIFSKLQNINLPKIFHSVGFPVACKKLALESQISALNESIELLNPLWISDHLSFNHISASKEFFASFLLPPLQKEKSLEIIVKNIKEIQQKVNLPFMFEIGANYLKPQKGEMEDGQFFAAIAKEANCGILFDLHNVWTNQKNGRQSIDSLMKTLPLNRIYETHLAAGRYHKGYWTDAHCGLVQDELWQVAQKVIPALPELKAINFEMVPEYIGRDNISQKDFLLQLEKMQELWQKRNTNKSISNKSSKKSNLAKCSNDTNPIEWQEQIGLKVTNINTKDSDSGIEIYQDLIASVRGGLLVSALPLITRYLRLSQSEEFFQNIIYKFWDSYHPEPYASDEAINFSLFLNNNKQLFDANCLEVINYEITLINSKLNNEDHQIGNISQKLQELLLALIDGKLPKDTLQASS